ncbi:MAG: diaminopimelate epimerase [Acidimicrobiales bacterium]
MTTVSLLKYHGLGNDFLIALDAGALTGDVTGGEVDIELVRRLCDRRRGIGADGVIIARRPEGGGDAAMELRNADGGRAETSGNGLRCFALALYDSGAVESGTMLIETDGGMVTAEVGSRTSDDCADVRVSMGTAVVGRPVRPAPLLGEAYEARCVEVGNPHLVLLGSSLEEIEEVDIAEIGRELERARPGGQNVEVVAPDGAGGLELRVWERGVGLTEACGSGSVAAAAAARATGVVGDRARVRNPGGVVVVELTGSPESPAAALVGPACRIAQVDVTLRKTTPAVTEAVR